MDEARLRARYRRIMAFFTRLTLSFIFWELLLPRLGLRSITRRTRTQRIRNADHPSHPNAAYSQRGAAISLSGGAIGWSDD